MDQGEKLALLHQEALACEACLLHRQCTQVVFGEGIIGKGLMVVGEGPGQDEDRQGNPFVGRAGQLLDKILEAGGFSRRTNAYIANIVKCRPPSNRAPLPEEREACLPWLQKQIILAEPKILILLGATALQALVDPNARIGNSRGKWTKYQGIPAMPTYHPAALLRNPKLKAEVWADMKLVIDKYREWVDPEHLCEYH